MFKRALRGNSYDLIKASSGLKHQCLMSNYLSYQCTPLLINASGPSRVSVLVTAYGHVRVLFTYMVGDVDLDVGVR